MCGISAAIGDTALQAETQVRSNLSVVRHRGPDGYGFISGQGFSIGHSRLAILGGKEISGQPFKYRGHWLAYNGEIHNYIELAHELREFGHVIPEGSDVPVVAAALSQWGADATNKFDGFFAFVFIDPVRRTALIGRDKLGQKPLHYKTLSTTNGELHFICSEAKALIGKKAPKIDAALLSVIAATYPNAPATCYASIKQFVPGEVYQINLRTGEIRIITKFKRLPPLQEPVNLPLKVRQLLSNSVSTRLLSDTPVGLLLSAGVDSGYLRSICTAEQVASNFAFDSGGLSSELKEVQSAFGDAHKITPVNLSFDNSEHFRATIERLHKALDAPLLSASLLALDALFSKANTCGIRVLLSGQGADELFGGYNYYESKQNNWISKKLNRIEKLGGWKNIIPESRDRQKAKFLISHIRKKHARIIVKEGPKDFIERREFDLFDGPLASMLWYEDRIAMHHSIEVRYPFLQLELIELTCSLTLKELQLGNESKGLLKASLGEDLPRHLLGKQPKRGLPANEQRLLLKFKDVFQEGIRAFGEETESDITAHITRLNHAKRIGRREAQVFFRIACAGLWLTQGQS